MEAIKHVAAQALSGQSAITHPGIKRLPDLEYGKLKLLCKQMQDHYPSQEFGPDTVKGYLFDFERLAVKHGLSRFERVMLDFRIRPGQRFFPHPSEVAEALESLVHREREEERLRATKFVRAVACQCSAHTDGYVIVAYAPGRPSGAYRCECWKDWKRDKDQNGGD